MIHNKLRVPRVDQSLIFDDQYLEDDKTLADYNIQNESTLSLVFGISGGGKKAVIKISKHEKLVLSKVKAKATYEAIPAFVLNPEITGQANSKYNEMMETNDENYLDELIEKMKLSEIELAMEYLYENKMGEQRVYCLAPYFVPELNALKQTAENCEKASKALECAFVHNFTLCYLNPDTAQYDFQAFYNYVEKRCEARRTERALVEKLGVAHDD